MKAKYTINSLYAKNFRKCQKFVAMFNKSNIVICDKTYFKNVYVCLNRKSLLGNIKNRLSS